MPRGGEGRMLMTRRLPRLLRTGSLPCHLSIATPVIAVILVAAVATAPVRTLPAVPSDPVAAGPAAWTDDLSPIAPSDWSYDRAAHLIERAGFGATPEEVARLAAMTPRQVVD